MAVFQKNDGEQTGALDSSFDGAISEQCNQHDECSNFEPYLAKGEPVLNAEYSEAPSEFCPSDIAAGIEGARFDVELDGAVFEPCWGG
jgi:Glycoside-hydrolase family GH114